MMELSSELQSYIIYLSSDSSLRDVFLSLPGSYVDGEISTVQYISYYRY